MDPGFRRDSEGRGRVGLSPLRVQRALPDPRVKPVDDEKECGGLLQSARVAGGFEFGQFLLA